MDAPDPTTTLPPDRHPPRPPFDGRRLRRRPEDGPIGGVCAGIADYLGVDVTVVRLAAVLLAVLGPGVPAYLVAWVVIPAAVPGEPRRSPGAGSGGSGLDAGERVPQFVGAAFLVLAAVIVWNRLDWPGDRFLLPLALIGAGVVLLARNSGDDDSSAPPSSFVGATDAPVTTVAPTYEVAGPPPPPPTTAFDVADHDPAPPRRRSPVAAAFFGATLVWGGIAFLAGLSPETGLAVALGILGLGLVTGAFLGGARALIFPGLVLTFLLIATAALDVPLRGGIGEREWQVESAADAEEPFRLAIGEGVLDLRSLRPGQERTVRIEASVALGHLEVLVPDDVDVLVDAEVDGGEVAILGSIDNGTDVHVEQLIDAPGTRGGRIELDLAVGLGMVEVHR